MRETLESVLAQDRFRHGPAVLSQGPSERVKEVADERYRVRRTAQPELDTNRNTVKVVYQMECEDRQSGKTVRFSEEHLMRYLFPTEVDLLAESCELRRVRTEEFLTGASAVAIHVGRGICIAEITLPSQQ